MEIQVYSIFDLKSLRFDTPFHQHSDLFAIRQFKMVADREGTMVNKFILDFELMKVGSFNDETGQLTGIKPVKIFDGVSYQREKTQTAERVLRQQQLQFERKES